jgi:antitoxin HigA-1
MKPGFYSPIHPGEVLKNEIQSTGSTIQAAADAIGIARKNLSLLINGHASLSVEMAVRVSKALGHTPEFWLNMQMLWDLSQINVKSLHVKSLKK